MVLKIGKNENITLYRIKDNKGNYLCNYRTTKCLDEANLYDGYTADLICNEQVGLVKEGVNLAINVEKKVK